MDRLDELALFIKIHEKGSLSAAGRDLGLSSSSVSEHLSALERHYGARLFNRTTRSINLTEEGRFFLEGARDLVDAAERLERGVRFGVERLSGTIRLSAPEDLGRHLIAQLIDDFMTDNPHITIELYLTDRYVDLVTYGFDLAVRLGELKDSSLLRVKLGKNRKVICAAPSYIDRFGSPDTPDALKDHRCLLRRQTSSVNRDWIFRVQDRLQPVHVAGTRISNDGAVVRQWCRAGHGIAEKSIWDVSSDIESGTLIEVLREYAPPPSSLQIVYPSGVSLPRRFAAFRDFLVERFRQISI